LSSLITKQTNHLRFQLGLSQEKSELEMRLQELETQLKLARAKRESEKPAIQQLEGEIAGLQEAIYQENHQQASIQKDLKALKTVSTELQDKIVSSTHVCHLSAIDVLLLNRIITNLS
jgi:chromosome segregation ATPase